MQKIHFYSVQRSCALRVTLLAASCVFAFALAGCASDGHDGHNGLNGAPGSAGAPGIAGAAGDAGAPGQTGGQGPAGEPGQSPKPLSVLGPALSNTGEAADQVLPLGLQGPLGNVGDSLDGVVSPVAGGVTQITQTAGDGLGIGAPADQLLTSLGGSLQQAGGVDSATPGLNGVVSSLGATIASAGGIVHRVPTDANPLGSTVDHATDTLVSLTGGLGLTSSPKAEGGLLSGLLGSGDQGGPLGTLLGGLTNGQGGGNLVSGLLGGGGHNPVGGELGSGVLAPVTGALGLAQTADSSGGALAPVTGLLGNVLGGLGHK